MHDTDWLAQRFEEHRTQLTAIAYRMLGSASEADDAIQEAWLRLSRSDTDSIENLGGWLTTVLSRVCLNVLQTRRSRPEVPLGPDVPEPAAGHAGAPERNSRSGMDAGRAATRRLQLHDQGREDHRHRPDRRLRASAPAQLGDLERLTTA